MAISDEKKRIKITFDRNYIEEVLKVEASKKGVSISRLVSTIVVAHFSTVEEMTKIFDVDDDRLLALYGD